MGTDVCYAGRAVSSLMGTGSKSERMKFAMMGLMPFDDSPFRGEAKKTLHKINELVSGRGGYNELGSRMTDHEFE